MTRDIPKLEVRKQHIIFTYGTFGDMLKQEKREKEGEELKRKKKKPNTHMKNVGKCYKYHKIEECLNEVQRGWYETINMLISQALITQDIRKHLFYWL